MLKTPTYSQEVEKAVCEWLTYNSKQTVESYTKLSDGFVLTEILSRIDSKKFDVKELWKFNETKKKGEKSGTAFAWNNLAILEESLTKCWDDEVRKSIFEVVEIDFSLIFKMNDLASIHTLVSIVFQTIIMLSKSEAALDMIQSIHNLKDSNQEIMKMYAEECVTLYTQLVVDSRAESQISSPSRFIDHSKNASILCFFIKN